MCALSLLTVGTVPLLLMQVADAAQVASRSIELSDSSSGATGVTYAVTFTPATSITHPDVIIDFCSNSPIIGDSCTATAGTDTPNFSGASAGGSWTLTTIGSNRGVKLTTTTVSFTSGTPVTITLTGVTNPTAIGTFYGRILTYTTGGAGTNTSASPGSFTDYGGVALSTANVIAITAKVIESLTFCVSGSAITTCGTTTSPNLTIGHTIGSNTILDNTATDTAKAYAQTSTNAQSGVTVRMKDTSSATCGGLSSNGGSSCAIPAVGATAATIPAGTAKFGACVVAGSANTTAAVPYNDTSGTCATPGATTKYGLDDTSGTSVISTFGSPIFSSSGALNQENDTMTFAATASLTTPAGIYTGNYALIATGTF